MTAPLLSVEHLTITFGGLVAIDDVSFAAGAAAITALIGPNGAGKTTIFNCLTGFYKAPVGRMALHHPTRGLHLLERLDGHVIADKAGVARTFQNVRLFPRMTALENLIVAQHNKIMRATGLGISGLVGLNLYRKVEKEAIELACHWLDAVGLTGLADREAGELPYGAQRRLEIARAMCIEPVLLCLDEPAAGLNPRETHELGRLLTRIREREGIGILLIEHDMSVVMDVSDRIIVLDHGRKIAEGEPQAVRANPDVIRAYLGEPDAPVHPVGAEETEGPRP
jgi:branched-chain amino acid transport system ATP-binding protein